MAASIRDQFVKDIAQHQIDIQLDQGVFRHVVFKQPNTIHRLFSLTTTPGRLVYGGDMGCFVFERLPDMFQFFRSCPDSRAPNFDYWHEKLVAVDQPYGSWKRRQYTIRFLWACHAIQWGISQYDRSKQVAEPLDAEGGA